jgi:hypothetical protein
MTAYDATSPHGPEPGDGARSLLPRRRESAEKATSGGGRPTDSLQPPGRPR